MFGSLNYYNEVVSFIDGRVGALFTPSGFDFKRVFGSLNYNELVSLDGRVGALFTPSGFDFKRVFGSLNYNYN